MPPRVFWSKSAQAIENKGSEREENVQERARVRKRKETKEMEAGWGLGGSQVAMERRRGAQIGERRGEGVAAGGCASIRKWRFEPAIMTEGSRRGTPGQLVGRTVEGQVAGSGSSFFEVGGDLRELE
jgi:hypothetical protein